nr:MMPL family transporter [Paenibacillus apiarius]
MYRWRHWVWSVWAVLFLAMAFFAFQVPSMLKDNGFTPAGSESDNGLNVLRDEMGISATMMDIVYESKDGSSLLTDQAKQSIGQSLSKLQEQPYVTDLHIRQDGRIGNRQDVTSVNVIFNMDTNDALEQYPDIRKLIPDIPSMNIYASGATPVYYDMQEASKRDIVKSEMIGLPIALVVLLIVFGTLLAGLLPLIVGLFSVTVTLGLLYFIALSTDSLSNFLPNVVTMLGLAVGIDYALFMVSRFREELRSQPSIEQAVAMTAQRAGQSIFFSGVAVLIGLVAMAFIDLSLFRSLSLGGVMVVSMSVIVGNTLLLSLLGVFGEKINRYPVIPRRFRRSAGGEESRFWSKIAHGVMKRPIAIVLLLCAILMACAWPVGGMRIGIPDAEVLPPKYESRYGADLMNEVYDPHELNPVQLVLLADKPYTELAAIQAAEKWADRIRQVEGVRRVDSYVSALAQLPTAEAKAGALQNERLRAQLEGSHLVKDRLIIMQVIPDVQPDGDEAFELVRQLRALDLGSGVNEKYVTGGPAVQLDIIDRITNALPYVVGFILLVTYFVLFIAFRSVLLPLKAVLMNILSLGASLGIVVLVFQHGHLADLFQVTSTGMVVAMLPVIIFCVVFGISMDYEVFLLSRIAEEYDRTKNNEHSTAEGLKKTGSIITSAAFILIVVVGAFIFTDNEMMKAIGLGLATSVLLDATLIRVFLVPALMKLMGKLNWWAPRMFRSKSERNAA